MCECTPLCIPICALVHELCVYVPVFAFICLCGVMVVLVCLHMCSCIYACVSPLMQAYMSARSCVRLYVYAHPCACDIIYKSAIEDKY